jgi:hypothetical protein
MTVENNKQYLILLFLEIYYIQPWLRMQQLEFPYFYVNIFITIFFKIIHS